MDNHSIARSAARLRWAVFVGIGLILLFYIAARFNLQGGPIQVQYRTHGVSSETSRLIGDLGILLLGVALFRLTQMLGLIASGQLFSATVISRFRSFAFWLLVRALLSFLGPFIVELARDRPAGPHAFTLGMDLQELLTLGITLLLFLLARLLERAREIEEEMQEIV